MKQADEIIMGAYECWTALPKSDAEVLALWRDYWLAIGAIGAMHDWAVRMEKMMRPDDE